MKAFVDSLPRSSGGVVLRRLDVSDLAAFQAYRSDADLGRYQGWPAMSDAEARVFLEMMNAAPLFRPGHWVQLGIAEAQGRTLVGDIGLFLSADSHYAEVGFTLSRPAQGRGLATQAVREALQLIFESTAVERVLGVTDARNSASMRLLERVGMRRLETRQVVFRGEPCVEYVYTLVRNDG